jgi:hypothetical protein
MFNLKRCVQDQLSGDATIARGTDIRRLGALPPVLQALYGTADDQYGFVFQRFDPALECTKVVCSRI